MHWMSHIMLLPNGLSGETAGISLTSSKLELPVVSCHASCKSDIFLVILSYCIVQNIWGTKLLQFSWFFSKPQMFSHDFSKITWHCWSTYFNHINGSSGIPLPNPESSLSWVVNWVAIKAANEEVLKGHTKGLGVKWLPYLKATPAQKALVGKYTVKHGVMNSTGRFQKDFHENALKFMC